jgi:tripartite ATP-independent transporter DctM subunit
MSNSSDNKMSFLAKFKQWGTGSLTYAGILLFILLTLFPITEIIGRPFNFFPITGNASWVQQFTLWITFIGAILAALQNKHLAVGAAKIFNFDKGSKVTVTIISLGTFIILLALAKASYDLVYFQRESPETIGGWFPTWLAQAAMPAGFMVLGIVVIQKAVISNSLKWLVFITGILMFLILTVVPMDGRLLLTTPLLVALVILTFLGLPIYAALGGVGLLLFYSADIPIAALPTESYRILTQPVLPSIPLFALAGTVLAKGGAPQRLIRFVNAWTSWLPGGAALATVIGCALFTAITGASGVTILALGGLLLPILIAAKYKQNFSIGLLTASGSVGLLFPPSLPVILYGIYGFVAIDRLFIAGFIPGVILILILAIYSIYTGKSRSRQKKQFDFKEVLSATWTTKGDLLLPIVVVVGLFGGFFTLVETAAITAFWAILLEVVFHRKLNIRKNFTGAALETLVLTGALLIVLGLASGLVSYLVDEQIPLKATDWVTNTIHSKIVFLLILNLILLLVGAVMDIYSAIVVFVPLIVPMGIAFGIDTAHLGIIFLANLELGYMTPPVGMNLFFSSLRFEKPLLKIWKMVIPFLLIFIIWVLSITYIPQLTLFLPQLFGR